MRTEHERGEIRRARAGEHRESIGRPRKIVAELDHLAVRLLDADDVRMLAQYPDGFGKQVDAGVYRHVVEKDGDR
jgi:hypothetical protein